MMFLPPILVARATSPSLRPPQAGHPLISMNRSSDARTLSEAVSLYLPSSQDKRPGNLLEKTKLDRLDLNAYRYAPLEPWKSFCRKPLGSLDTGRPRSTPSSLAMHLTILKRKRL